MLDALAVLVTVIGQQVGTVVLEDDEFTAARSGGVPCAVALLAIDCAETSAAVVVYFPVHVSDGTRGE